MKSKSGIGTPYWYEWLCGLVYCIDMLYDSSIKSVTFQSDDFTCLDDVVVKKIDGSLMNIQIKHTDNSNNMTLSFLFNKNKPLLKSLAKEWFNLEERDKIKEIVVLSNKKWGKNKTKNFCSFKTFVNEVLPNLKKYKNYKSSNKLENNLLKKIRSELNFMDKDSFNDFFKLLRFEEQVDYKELEEKLLSKIDNLVGGHNERKNKMILDSLKSQLSVWTTSLRNKKEVTKEDVLKILCNGYLEKNPIELKPETPIFPSRIKFAKEFYDHLSTTSAKVVFLKGYPGSGKTNFVSYLHYCHQKESLIFYTYLPVKIKSNYFSNDSGRYREEDLWDSLLDQLERKFESLNLLGEVKFPICFASIENSSKKSLFLKYVSIYAQKIKTRVCVLIDGLDHAARALNSSKSNNFLNVLIEENEIPDDVIIVYSGQPDVENYPSFLKSLPSAEQSFISNITAEDIPVMFEELKVILTDDQIKHISNNIIILIGNNVLNVLFAIKEISIAETLEELDIKIKDLKNKKLDKEISKYYDWICSNIEDNLLIKKLFVVFSELSSKISIDDLSLLIGEEKLKVSDAISHLFPIIVLEDEKCFCFHNDVRLFFQEKEKNYFVLNDIIEEFSKNIFKNNNLNYLKFNFLFDLLIKNNKYFYLKKLLNYSYVIDGIKNNIPIREIENQFKLFFELNKKNLEENDYLSLIQSLKTIIQAKKSIDYNEIQYPLIDAKNLRRSEIEMLSLEKDVITIISDIAFLLENNEEKRAKNLFLFFLNKYSYSEIAELFEYKQGSPNHAYNLGKIFRKFKPDIFKTSKQSDSKFARNFSAGWLAQSKNEQFDVDNIKIDTNLTYYNFKDFYSFIISVSENVDETVLNYLIKQYLNIPYGCLVEVSRLLALKKKLPAKIKRYLLSNANKLFLINQSDINYDLITLFFKMYFCVYDILSGEDEKQIDILFSSLQEKTFNGPDSRGYGAIINLRNISESVFKFFYFDIESKIINQVFDLVFFGDRFGSGTAFDVRSDSVSKFLYKLYSSSVLNYFDNDKIFSVAKALFDNVFNSGKKAFIPEFLPIFEYSKETLEIEKQIFDLYVGNKGIAWNEGYTDVEFFVKHAVDFYSKQNDKKMISKLIQKKNLRILGCIDYKDYSLSNINYYFNQLANTVEKFNLGLRLFALSEQNEKMGNNRVHSDICSEMIKTSLYLGPKYLDSIFFKKNNFNEFYNYRNLILDSIFESFYDTSYSEADLQAFQKLFIAWIDPKIERTTSQYYSNLPLLDKAEKYFKTKQLEITDSKKGFSFELDDNAKRIKLLIDKKGVNNKTIIEINKFFDDYNNYEKYKGYFDCYIQNDKEKETYLSCVYIPLVKKYLKYDLSYNGDLNVLINNANLMRKKDFIDLLDTSITKYFDEENFEMVENVERLFFAFSLNNYSESEKLNLFEKEIVFFENLTKCNDVFELNKFEVSFDKNILTFANFVKKYINK